ncbi:PREDICTED: putative nuclease HARBI1 [Fragaria vesca subsp. vesca]|uniref:putative nuclease HARBI1 n=1 Tax=Fragaria vesca subsp. vesca TaxID=101020 RepID=UPI0002C35C6B|nr:PREDICTED: putative nuclease HARBI1 [Fragaria vesca subsp. vesca]
MDAMMTNATMMMVHLDTSDEPQGRGSRPGRSPNHPRHRVAGGTSLMVDYFIERPIFREEEFRRRYRMHTHLFNHIMTALCNHDPYWHQKADATGKLGLLPQQKMTGALRMLAYGATADQCAEICRMGESTTLECMKKFCQHVIGIFGPQYLRAPTKADLQKLLARADQRGFPGMIGSIDCMHWEWKNCPTGWHGAYSGRKGRPTIILEAVASHDTWVWHAFFGVPGAQNDINVLNQSPVFEGLIAGNSPAVTFHANGRRYSNAYYLADGIYPRYSTFVKTIPNPESQAQKLFAKKQEAYRKDVERCFGILQSRWAILRHGARLHRSSTVRSIMITCIILHNMIVEDEFVEEEFVEPEEEDLLNPLGARVYDGPVDHEGVRIPFLPVERNGRNQHAFWDRIDHLESAYIHTILQNDLVEHNWALEANQQ